MADCPNCHAVSLEDMLCLSFEDEIADAPNSVYWCSGCGALVDLFRSGPKLWAKPLPSQRRPAPTPPPVNDRPDWIWIPCRSVMVTVEAYNDGGGRMVRIAGPSGMAGMAPMDRYDHDGMVRWALERLPFELRTAMGQVDQESEKHVRRLRG